MNRMMDISWKRYAELLLSLGVRITQGQTLLLELPQEHWPFARIVEEAAYQMGAEDVIVFYNDIQTELPRIKACAAEGAMPVPEWKRAVMQDCLSGGGASLSLLSPYPGTTNSLTAAECRIWTDYQNDLRNIVRNAIRKERIHWCYACLPNREWAEQVYPDLSPESALRRLQTALMDICMVNETHDPVNAWLREYDRLHVKAEKLNALPIKSLHMVTGLGTDLFVGVHKDCIWEGGISQTEYRQGAFQPNIPSYEICTTTLKHVTSGTMTASMPLNFNGNLISGLSLSFQDGRVCSYDAAEGRQYLKQILEHDEGSAYLGEIAFLEKDSPIAKTGALFYNTLLDENASCHLALGAGFPGNIRGIDPRDEQSARESGVNFSEYHVDIMFGTPDIDVDGMLENGQVVPVMRQGKFVL